MFSLFKQVLVLFALLATIALGYYLYARNGSALEDTTNAEGSAAVAIEAASFLSRLNELRAIDLDAQVFSDPRFSYLEDHSRAVVSEPVGARPNPFKKTE
jgi:type II secretory pathway pseudopilin PulG